MAKSAHDDVTDTYLEEIQNNVNLMCACSSQPTTRAEAASTYALATVALAPGDMAVSDGATGGRKLTISAKSNVPIVAGGNMAHVALVDNSKLYFVTTTALLALLAGHLLNIPSWSITVNDPT
jgi:hypothetical protein